MHDIPDRGYILGSGEYEKSLSECGSIVRLNPVYAKGYVRRGIGPFTTAKTLNLLALSSRAELRFADGAGLHRSRSIRAVSVLIHTVSSAVLVIV